MQRVTVRNLTRSTVVAGDAEIAKTWWTRLRGLLGRSNLTAGAGLIILPCSSIHTFFMAFPIDVLFVSKENRVLKASTAIGAWRIGPVVPQARYVIELPVGAIAASQTVSGDELDWSSG